MKNLTSSILKLTCIKIIIKTAVQIHQINPPHTQCKMTIDYVIFCFFTVHSELVYQRDTLLGNFGEFGCPNPQSCLVPYILMCLDINNCVLVMCSTLFFFMFPRFKTKKIYCVLYALFAFQNCLLFIVMIIVSLQNSCLIFSLEQKLEVGFIWSRQQDCRSIPCCEVITRLIIATTTSKKYVIFSPLSTSSCWF